MVAASRSPRGGARQRALSSRRNLHGAALDCLLGTTNCAQFPPTSSVAIPSIPSGAARLPLYRDYERPERGPLID